jgi:penicillin-binding protein 2
MDIVTGDVLALACHPAYDPNAFIRGIKPQTWNALRRDPATPLINKAIAGTYAPGSTFKMLVALAALEANVVTPHSTFFCPGHLSLGRARFHCWKRGGHGHMNVKQAIKQSCDVFFYETALKLGVDRIAAVAGKFGLGDRIGIDLPSEAPGLIPTRAWKRKQFRDKWHPGETVITGIGQGYVLATPMQLAVMTARLASGKAVEPRLFRGLYEEGKGVDTGDYVPRFAELGFNAAKLGLVRDGMNAVTNEPGGTAHWTRIVEEEYRMAGKTGTSQVRRITLAERARGVIRNEDLPWERRDHALFVAYAPVDKPRYACVVIVEHGGSGSRAAAPVAKDILREAQLRNSAAPTRVAAAAAAGGAAPAAAGN